MDGGNKIRNLRQKEIRGEGGKETGREREEGKGREREEEEEEEEEKEPGR